MIRALYKCTQQELYTICRTAWAACTSHLPAFTNFSPSYDSAFIADRILEIKEAELVPDQYTRQEISETYRVKLDEQSQLCTDAYQSLKRYIVKAYPANLHKILFNSAGQEYFEKAANNNWDSVNLLNNSVSTFLDNHLSELTANQVMPPSFVNNFNLIRAKFDTLHAPFLNEENNLPQGTQDKIIANNKIYTAVMNMLLDGQDIFKRNDAIKKKFVFSDLHYLASGAGTSGIKGYITDSLTLMPIKDVTVTFFGSNKSTTTDSEGRYEILQVAAGTYTIKYTKEGYNTVVIENHEIKTGTLSTASLSMKPVE